MGWPIYLESIRPQRLTDTFYRGMNGIIRTVDAEAYRDFSTITDIDTILMAYWRDRDERLRAGQHSTSARKAARETHLNRPFFTLIHFEPKALSPMTVGDWVEFLFDRNPHTPYRLRFYNYVDDRFYQSLLAEISRLPRLRDSQAPAWQPIQDLAVTGIVGFNWNQISNFLDDLFYQEVL